MEQRQNYNREIDDLTQINKLFQNSEYKKNKTDT
jgi:hypothetical protein